MRREVARSQMEGEGGGRTVGDRLNFGGAQVVLVMGNSVEGWTGG